MSTSPSPQHQTHELRPHAKSPAYPNDALMNETLFHAFEGFATMTSAPSKQLPQPNPEKQRREFQPYPTRENADLKPSSANLSSASVASERSNGQPPTTRMNASREDDAMSFAVDDAKGGSWIAVHRLDPHTSSKMLLDLFFPYGASEAFLLSAPASCRKTGFVVFPSANMADLAAQKMNDFIPCRQTQALRVETISAAEVKAAKTRDIIAMSLEETTSASSGKQTMSNVAQMSLLVDMTSTTAANVAHFIQQRSDPEATAEELIEEMGDASLPKIRKYADSFAAIMENWPYRKNLQTATVRNMLSCILDSKDARDTKSEDSQQKRLNTSADNSLDGSRDSVHNSSATPSTEDTRRRNCGLLLGHLFVNKFITGDPFEVAARLLRSDITAVSQLDAICNIAEVASALPNARSSSSFWALVAEITATHSSPVIRLACSQKLGQHFVKSRGSSGLSADATPFMYRPQGGSSSRGNSPLNTSIVSDVGRVGSSSLSRRRAEEGRSRTVYMSRLSPGAPVIRLRQLADSCGVVLKIRVCIEPGYSTLFGFIEMANAHQARAVLRRDREEFFGFNIRFQPAKMPIQDVDVDDAFEGPDGTILKVCQYGMLDNASTTVQQKAMMKPATTPAAPLGAPAAAMAAPTVRVGAQNVPLQRGGFPPAAMAVQK